MNMDYLDPRSQGYDSGFRVPPVLLMEMILILPRMAVSKHRET